MESKKQLFLLFCVIGMLFEPGSVHARSTPHKREISNSYMLSDVADKTLCPMRVTVNKNEERIPRYIKFITCDVQESPSYDAQHCSYRMDKDHVSSCVQLEDYAPVMYLTENGTYENSTLKVAVGCACMSRKAVVPVEES